MLVVTIRLQEAKNLEDFFFPTKGELDKLLA